MDAVKEDGARGGGVVRGDSAGLFKGPAVGLDRFPALLVTTARQAPSIGLLVLGAF